jgi:hypothetical protein
MEITRDGSDYYRGPRGEFRWRSNGAVVPPSCWSESRMADPMPENQQAERDAEVTAFLAEYRAAAAGRPVSAEQRAEERAAFGPGVKLVNVITGETHTT